MNFFSYIVCWDEVYNNVLNIENDFTSLNVPHKVINSGSRLHDNWMNVGDIRYYRQLHKAVKDFDRSYEYMFWLAGDVSYNNWSDFIDRANESVSLYNVFAYAPHLTSEPWHEGSSKIINLTLDNKMLLSIQTDGIAVILHKDIVDMLEKYLDFVADKTDITQLTSGWGMDMIWSAYSIYMNKLVLRDNMHILNHPAGSSYGHDRASKELKIILDLFYEFCDDNKIDSIKIRNIHEKIYGRMQRREDCLHVDSFYSASPEILKNTYPINYHIIHIDDIRLSNRKSLQEVLNGEKIDIPCLNAKKDGEIDLFKQNNPEFKFAWDGFKLGEIGNFGSHYLAWKYLRQSNLNELIVFEDDALIDYTFHQKFQTSMNLLPKDYDIFSIYVDKNQHPRFDESQRISYHIAKGYQDWSTLCYVISKRGAEKLCKYVEEIGFDHPTDWFIFRKGHQGIFNVYTLPPYIENPLSIDSRYESQVQ